MTPFLRLIQEADLLALGNFESDAHKHAAQAAYENAAREIQTAQTTESLSVRREGQRLYDEVSVLIELVPSSAEEDTQRIETELLFRLADFIAKVVGER